MLEKELEAVFKMHKDEVERDFAPYFYQYFKLIFENPSKLSIYSRDCKHIFDVTCAKGKRVLDMGCGFGLISLHLAYFGAQAIVALDLNDEKIEVLQKIICYNW